MRVRQIVMAFVLAGLMAGGVAYATTVKPDVPINYCEWAWWAIECYF